jgi:CBS domain-containing protein
MPRQSTLLTVPNDVMLDGLSRNWSCAAIEAGPTQHPAALGSEPADEFAGTSPERLVTEHVQATAAGRTVGEIMRLPTKFSEHAPLVAAAEVFAGGRTRLAVVVTKQNKPLGIVTPAQVLRIVKERSFDRIPSVTVLEAATSGGAFLTDTTSIRDAAERFATEDQDALVVVSRDGILAGVLMACDLPLVVDWVYRTAGFVPTSKPAAEP